MCSDTAQLGLHPFLDGGTGGMLPHLGREVEVSQAEGWHETGVCIIQSPFNLLFSVPRPPYKDFIKWKNSLTEAAGDSGRLLGAARAT